MFLKVPNPPHPNDPPKAWLHASASRAMGRGTQGYGSGDSWSDIGISLPPCAKEDNFWRNALRKNVLRKKTAKMKYLLPILDVVAKFVLVINSKHPTQKLGIRESAGFVRYCASVSCTSTLNAPTPGSAPRPRTLGAPRNPRCATQWCCTGARAGHFGIQPQGWKTTASFVLST